MRTHVWSMRTGHTYGVWRLIWSIQTHAYADTCAVMRTPVQYENTCSMQTHTTCLHTRYEDT